MSGVYRNSLLVNQTYTYILVCINYLVTLTSTILLEIRVIHDDWPAITFAASNCNTTF